MKKTFRIDYEFNSNWSHITNILIQQLVWPGSPGMKSDWDTLLRLDYQGESTEKEAKRLLENLERNANEGVNAAN